MAAEDALRLAWLADRAGHATRRDALVTLAVAAGAAEGAPWVERARAWLIVRRPDHFFGAFPSLAQALADPRVLKALSRLHYSFPDGRVRWLLRRSASGRGPYTARRESLAIIMDDLFRAPSRRRPVQADPIPQLDEATRVQLTRSYVTVLLAMAVLLDNVLDPPADRKSRAA
jgi:hypothetical protein